MKKILYILVLITLVLFIDKINAYTEYKIGDVVPYNNVDYYVIKDSSASEESVTMLKAEPLTVAEVNQYGAGHVNMYNCSDSDTSCYHTAYDDNNGYGGMAYYTSVNCGYGQESNHTDSGCTIDYAQSEIKYVVDAWKAAKASAATDARLITFDELIDNLGYDMATWNVSMWQVNTEYTPNWVYNSNYRYWTMSQYNDSSSGVWRVAPSGGLSNSSVFLGDYRSAVVRPVITISKIALGDTDESIDGKNSESDDVKKNEEEIKENEKDSNNKTNETKTTVKVANTYMNSSIVIIILGFITASISILVIYKLSNKKR